MPNPAARPDRFETVRPLGADRVPVQRIEFATDRALDDLKLVLDLPDVRR